MGQFHKKLFFSVISKFYINRRYVGMPLIIAYLLYIYVILLSAILVECLGV